MGPTERTGPIRDQRRPEAAGLLIVAYGNDLMGDDGAGPALAVQLGDDLPEGVRVIIRHQLTPELADDVSRSAHVVFVDARVPDGNLDAVLSPLVGHGAGAIGHVCDPASLMDIARTVFGAAPDAWLLSLPTSSMALGEGLSEIAADGVQHGISLLRQHMRSLGYTA